MNMLSLLGAVLIFRFKSGHRDVLARDRFPTEVIAIEENRNIVFLGEGTRWVGE